IRVEVDREDLRDQRTAIEARARVEQLAQARVLRLERRQPLEPEARLELLALQTDVVLHEHAPLRDRGRNHVTRAERQVDDDPDGVDRDGEPLAHAVQMQLVMVEHHHRNAQAREENKPEAARYAAASWKDGGGSARTIHRVRSSLPVSCRYSTENA